jgi:hypothetical protein
MRRSPQRGDARRHASVGICAGGTDQAHGRGGCVLLVIGVQDEEQVERLRGNRRQFQRLRRHLEHHVQEARAVFKVVARVPHRPADRIAIAGGRNGGYLGDQADRCQATLLRILHVEVIVVEGRERTDHAGQHRHRMRVVPEAGQEALEGLVHHGVVRDLVLERFELRRVGQFAVHQQVGHFDEVRVLGKLFDRVAAVHQHARVAIDIGDGAAAARGGNETRVEGEVAGVLVELADVDHLRPERAGQQRQRRGLVRRGVGQHYALGVGHGVFS